MGVMPIKQAVQQRVRALKSTSDDEAFSDSEDIASGDESAPDTDDSDGDPANLEDGRSDREVGLASKAYHALALIPLVHHKVQHLLLPSILRPLVTLLRRPGPRAKDHRKAKRPQPRSIPSTETPPSSRRPSSLQQKNTPPKPQLKACSYSFILQACRHPPPRSGIRPKSHCARPPLRPSDRPP